MIGKLELNDEHLLAEPASLIRICAELLTCFTTIISEENLQDCDEDGSASAGRLINVFLLKSEIINRMQFEQRKKILYIRAKFRLLSSVYFVRQLICT